VDLLWTFCGLAQCGSTTSLLATMHFQFQLASAEALGEAANMWTFESHAMMRGVRRYASRHTVQPCPSHSGRISAERET